MKKYSSLTILFAIALSVQVSNAQQKTGGLGGFHVVGTTKLAATLSTGRGRERITGRVSLSLSSVEGRGDLLRVRDFNIVFFGVSQGLIAPKACQKELLGVVGFAPAPGKAPMLYLDQRRSQITGQIEMAGDASVLSSLVAPIHDQEGDVVHGPKLVTTAAIRINLETPLGDRNTGHMTSRGKLDFTLSTRGARYRDFEVSSFTVGSDGNTLLDLDLATDRYFEVVRSLCVQPVNLFVFEFDPFSQPLHVEFDASGSGLKFGEPGARTEWEKADVTFEIRPWKSVRTFVVRPADTIDRLLSTVDDDDCIEIFFVKAFDPPGLWGAGSTFEYGSNSKIVTGDENAVWGIDLTCLAHELGHVLGLGHPDSTNPGERPASTGTLMCPSGFRRDNPRRNSQENRDLVSNPLLITGLRASGLDVDCQDSVDCGRCR